MMKKTIAPNFRPKSLPSNVASLSYTAAFSDNRLPVGKKATNTEKVFPNNISGPKCNEC